MRPFYKHLNKELEIFYGKAGHEPPHIHTAIECVYVRKGGSGAWYRTGAESYEYRGFCDCLPKSDSSLSGI